MLRVLLVLLLVSNGTAVAAQGGLSLSVSPPRAPTGEPPCMVCGVLKQQLKGSCVIGGPAPFADVIYLRQLDNPDVPAPLRKAIAVARASGDLSRTRGLLSPFLDANVDAESRYAAGLFLAMASLQAGEPVISESFQRGLTVMSEVEEQVAVPVSDLYYLRAIEERDRGDDRAARTLIKEALLIEPTFFNALVLGIELWSNRATAFHGSSRTLCAEAYSTLIGYTAALTNLSPCAYLSAHVDIHLSKRLAAPDSNAPLAVVRTYLSLISRRPDLAELALESFSRNDTPLCRAAIKGELEDLIKTYTETQSEAEQ